MIVIYLALLAICSILTLVLAFPGFAMMAVIVTFGLAYPLLFVLPTATILLWSLLPAVLMRHGATARSDGRPLRLAFCFRRRSFCCPAWPTARRRD